MIALADDEFGAAVAEDVRLGKISRVKARTLAQRAATPPQSSRRARANRAERAGRVAPN